MPIDPHGPPREGRTRSLAGAVVSTVPLVLLPFAVNVASDSLPGGAQRWAWLSWPAIIVLVALSWRLGAGAGAPTGSVSAPGAAAGPYSAPGAPAGGPHSTSGAPAGGPYSAPGAPAGGPYSAPGAPAGPCSGSGAAAGSGSVSGAGRGGAGAAGDSGTAAGPFSWHPRADGWAPGPAPAGRPHGDRPAGAASDGRASRRRVPFVVRARPRPLRWLAVPMTAASTALLISQFHLVGVHAPVLAGVLIVIIAVVLCFAELLTPAPVPRGAAAGLTYTVLAGMAVWRWDSSRADLWFVAESGVILGLGVFLATRMRDPRALRRVLPGVVLALLGWCAMGVLFAIYQDEETVVADAAFFACLSTVVAGTIAASLQAVAARDA